MLNMKKITYFLFAIGIALTFINCSTSKAKFKNSKDLSYLVELMSGSFNSSAQAKSDTSYFDISLHMCEIWKDKNAHWLYVEQAVTKNPLKPYRQRVYKVEQISKSRFSSSVYTIKNQEKWIEKWKNPKDLNLFTENDIDLKNGCAVMLELQKDGTFKGGTEGTGCESNLRGATYATSKVTISKTILESWDQGFDSKGKQVWGAVKGPYQFVKN